MAFLPKIEDRHYSNPLWAKKRDGSRGRLICHSCLRCGKQLNGNGSGDGFWLEIAAGQLRGKYAFACNECILTAS